MTAEDALTIGERFTNDMAVSAPLQRLGPVFRARVLVAGCYTGGEDVQFWLRRGVDTLDGVDVYILTATWGIVAPALAARWVDLSGSGRLPCSSFSSPNVAST